MSSARLAGYVVDQLGGEIEVWLVEDGTHVVLKELDAQIGDFPLGSPCKADPLQVTAERVAKGEAKRLTVIIDDDDDTVIEDVNRYKTLRSWPGDGRVH